MAQLKDLLVAAQSRLIGDVAINGLTTHINNVVPGTDNTYSLGTNSLRWKEVRAVTFYGALSGNASTATKLASTGTTGQFWRGDNTWSNEIKGGLLKITNNSNTVTIGSANSSWCHIENSANINFYFNKAIHSVGGFTVYNTSTSLTNNYLTFNSGGGWYMSDTTWIRTYGSKSVYMNTGTLRNDGITQVRTLQHINSNIVVDGDWVMGARGLAGTATTFTNPNDSSQTKTGYTGAVTGTSILTLGNNKAAGSNGSSYSSPGSQGTNDNAQGYLRIYNSGTGYSETTSYGSWLYPSTGLAIPVNKIGIMFRPDSSSYYTHFSYETSGNEALVAATQNTVTSFIFVNGESYANVSASRWTQLTGASGAGNAPGLQIKQNCVRIGGLWGSGTNADYRLRVDNGSIFVTKAGECGVEIDNTQATNPHKGLFGVGASGNLGIYDRTKTKWVVYSDPSGNVVLNGNANTATKLATARTIQTNLASTSSASFDGSANITPGVTGTLGTGNGGTGNTAFTASRLVYSNTATKLASTSITSDGGYLGSVSYLSVNTAHQTDYKLYVNGSSYFNGDVTLPKNKAIYGTLGDYSSTTASDVGGLTWINISAAQSSTIDTHDTPSTSSTWWYVLRNRHTNTSNNYYTDLAIPFNSTGIYYKIVRGGSIVNASTNNGWTAVLDQLNYTTWTVTKTGSGASGTWGISISGNAATATQLATARTLWGQSFNGSANISGDMTNVGNITHTAETSNKYRIDRKKDGGGGWAYSPITIQDNSNTVFAYMGVYGSANALSYIYIGTNTGSSNWTADTNLKIAPNGDVTAKKFVGPLSGTATNATNIYSSASTAKAYVLGTTTASSANHATVYNASVYTSGSVLYGAAWNDYAEYRQSEIKEPGRCIQEVGNDTLQLTQKRLLPGCEIISDTFGFAIGETIDSKTPVATSGRVLAYPYEPREEFKLHIGAPVCSGPKGTVSIMTPEEEMKYPSRIIGTISAVPEYEHWGSGNVEVNGRVWIRIR